jgi:SAM-dependent methyltransferase
MRVAGHGIRTQQPIELDPGDTIMDSQTRMPPAAGRSRPTDAELADRYDLYERAVLPRPDAHTLIERIFRDLRGRAPALLREDFCGTARLCRTWCQSAPERRAVGVDIDPAVLVEARRRNLVPFAEELGGRLELVRADVLDLLPGPLPPADVIAALNFSFCVFKQRDRLRRYLAAAHAGLTRDGVLMLEMFGGTAAMDRGEETHRVDDFTYHWEQASFDPLTHDLVSHIHFSFADGSRLDRAFSYDWRLWSVPELRDLLVEVGFSAVKIYWEKLEPEVATGDEDVRHGSGEYEPREVADQQDTWLVYIAAAR